MGSLAAGRKSTACEHEWDEGEEIGDDIDPEMSALLSPSGGEESNDNASTSEEYQVDEEVI